jgi:hypothetical protein
VPPINVSDTPVSSDRVTAPTPVWASSTPAKRRRFAAETDAAVDDLKSLPTTYLYAMAEAWFKENQPWCPLLSQRHILEAASALQAPVEYIEDIELRAVLALEISYSTQALTLGYKGRRRLCQHLRGQVLSEAMSNVALSSVSALIIIAFMDYGDDNLSSTFSLLSVCRRTCEHLGLFRRLLSQIQETSPSMVGPPGVEDTEGISKMIPWATLSLDAVSTLGVSWRDVSAALVEHLASIAYVTSPYVRDTLRAHLHLAAIGLQPVHQSLYERVRGMEGRTIESTIVECDEMYQNLMSYVHAQPQSSYTILENGLIDFDPNLVHTETLVHATTVIMYQGLVDFRAWSPAAGLERCVKACDEGMVSTIRNISDADAELNTPLLSHFWFVGARFKLVMFKHLEQSTDIAFDALMHVINMCARRWTIARRLDIVLRQAVIELEHPQARSLPEDFWDLRRSHLDISEQLKEWVASAKTALTQGSMSGPYLMLGLMQSN